MTQLGPTKLKILALILQAQHERRPITLRELMRETGCTSPNGTHTHLWDLRDDGLVTWEEHKSGTIRALCTMEAV